MEFCSKVFSNPGNANLVLTRFCDSSFHGKASSAPAAFGPANRPWVRDFAITAEVWYPPQRYRVRMLREHISLKVCALFNRISLVKASRVTCVRIPRSFVIFEFRFTGEREIGTVGRNAILGGRFLGRCFAGTRYDGYGSRTWRNGGEVRDERDKMMKRLIWKLQIV